MRLATSQPRTTVRCRTTGMSRWSATGATRTTTRSSRPGRNRPGRVTFTVQLHLQQSARHSRQQTDNGPGGRQQPCIRTPSNRTTVSCNWDHTHIFNAAYVVNLPSPVKCNKFAKGVVNGWILSGITQVQSGAPIQGEHRRQSQRAVAGQLLQPEYTWAPRGDAGLPGRPAIRAAASPTANTSTRGASRRRREEGTET